MDRSTGSVMRSLRWRRRREAHPVAGGAGRGRGRRAAPLRHERLRQPEAVEHPREGVVHDLVDLLGPVVEGRHRRQDHRAHLGERGEHAEMAQVQRRLPHAEDERPPLLEGDVGRARDQGVGEAGRHRARRLDAARHDHHPVRLERARGQRGADVAVAVAPGGERLDVAQRLVGLLDDGALGRVGDHQVRLDARDRRAAARGSGSRRSRRRRR